MESNWATENLQVIRTLMERSAVYRRALGPVMIFTGCMGTAASLIALWRGIDSGQGFVRFWVATGFLTIIGVLLLIRRQALKDVEPFWSPPTRRIAQAITPPLLVGLAAATPFLVFQWRDSSLTWWLVPFWFGLYGCALSSAGFFMQRGMKIFGWCFVAFGCGIFVIGTCLPQLVPPLKQAHVLMGGAFGGLHLLYGIYLYFTEKRKNAA
jgi:hypothetical protein